ncbi:diacylglycerol kinase family lipid kinase [bacterium]|nr:diacylglycerol kinase family lipid kinase [bacterium]
MPKVFVVQNPVAGTHSAERVTSVIRKFIDEMRWESKFHFTREDEDVALVVADAVTEGYDLFLAAGGDGTVSMVATGLKGTNLPMAIIPVGTGNGMARDLKIPLMLHDAVGVLENLDSVRMLDAIEVGDQYYLLNLSVGLTPLALKESKREEKRKLGMIVYFMAGIKAFVGIQPVTYTLKIDGKDHFFRASEVMLMNSFVLGDTGRILGLDIVVDDGVLDLFVIEARTFLDYLRVLWFVIIGKPQRDPDLTRFQVRESLSISARRLLEVQADGELIGYTPLSLRLIPQAVKMVVPKEQPTFKLIG